MMIISPYRPWSFYMTNKGTYFFSISTIRQDFNKMKSGSFRYPKEPIFLNLYIQLLTKGHTLHVLHRG